MAKQGLGMQVRIWDIWVRTFHWALAVSVAFLLFSGETGWQFFEWHRHVGEFVLLLIAFRLLWGLIGSSNARLLPLITSPIKAFTHLKHVLSGKVAQEGGHNAAGGWAVLAMLGLIGFQALSGLFIADEDELIEGAFYGLLDYDISERLLHLHHLNAEFLMVLVGIHVLMILIYLLRAGQNLILPMITGKLLWSSDQQPPTTRFATNWLGLVLFVACAVLIGWGLSWFKF